jgi:hypothetical protein
MLLDLSQVSTIGELEEVYKSYYKKCVKNKDKAALDALLKAKDTKKSAINMKEFNEEYDGDKIKCESGEINT